MMYTLKTLRTVAAAALACTALSTLPTTTIAAEDTVFDGSKARVNLSEKLAMLTQHVASASCRISAGINTEAAVQDLALARDQFNTILDGLENGATALGIPKPEGYAVVLRSIGKVREQWAPMDAAAADMIKAGGNTGGGAVIAGGNLALMDATNILASDISGKYSNPHELTQADALALHFAARQRMLGHQMAKEICGIATNVPAYGTGGDLAQTVNIYNLSLNALDTGMPEAGINPPPNEVIGGELDKIAHVWTQNLPALNMIASGTVPSASNVDTVARLSNAMQTEMDNVVTLYMLSTPGQEDVYRVPLRAYAEEQLAQWLTNPELIKEIKAQNARNANLTQADIDSLDKQWRAERKQDSKPLIADLLGRPSSEWLRQKQAETARFVTEVFAMDNKGLNVAQSDETSDYWQGDEAKWQQTFGNGSGDMHISEVEFDESTGSYQSQVSMVIRDPATGEMIGAITFGINVQSLL